MEKITTINGVEFVNDSKATTAESTLWALKNIHAPIILIAGGKDKGVDYGVILEVARGKVKKVILIGEAKEKIRAGLKGLIETDDAATLDEAAGKALLSASGGDCVILSPMCSSFDMFKDYEERGRLFKQAVFRLTHSS
jgi:UDP-N-acetylmuramoylalanine--D-glutamate ligase